MPIRLPLKTRSSRCGNCARGSRARRSPVMARPSFFCRSKPSAGDWAALPHGAVLRGLYARKVRKEGDCCQLRVGARAADPADRRVPGRSRRAPFERLQAAGKLARAALGRRSRRRCCSGSRAATADDRRADVARDRRGPPSGGVSLRDASRASRNRARRSRGSISRSRGTLRDLDVTLATSAGNNIARWLTALPPNTLDARGYRRLLQGSCAPPEALDIRFYGESRAASASAPARFSRSRKAMRRAMPGIVRLAYRPRGAARPGREPRRQGHLLRYRRHQLEAAQGHARHAHRHGGQRRGASEACTRCMRCARRLRSIAGWRSRRTASGRSPTSRRTWCARTTARPSR